MVNHATIMDKYHGCSPKGKPLEAQEIGESSLMWKMTQDYNKEEEENPKK
jgi:hypothetical protein